MSNLLATGGAGFIGSNALSRTIQWYLDNEQWWRPLIDADYQAWVEQQYGAATRLASR